MAHSCPDCGHDVELHDRTARVRTGNCGGCGLVLTYLAEGGAPVPAEGGSTPSETAEPGAAPLPALSCPSCGGTLELTVGEGGDLAAACDDCDEEFTYRCIKVGEEPAAEAPEGPAPERRGGRRFERAPPRSFDRDGGEGPRARPCRQCGAPLTFTTLPDGGVEGSCASCGNRFSLPPRRDRFGDDRGGGGRRRFGGPPRGGGRPFPGRGGGARGGGSYGRGRRPYGRRESSDDEGEEGGYRRRRPRRSSDDE